MVERRLTGALPVEEADPGLKASLAGLSKQADARSHYAVSIEYLRLGIYDQALAHVDAVLRLDRRHGGAWDLRARVWREWGLPGLALGDAHRAVGYAPGQAAALNTLATVLLALDRRDDARSALVSAVMAEPCAAWARQNLGRLANQGVSAPAVPACAPHTETTRHQPAVVTGTASPTR